MPSATALESGQGEVGTAPISSCQKAGGEGGARWRRRRSPAAEKASNGSRRWYCEKRAGANITIYSAGSACVRRHAMAAGAGNA
eukprot:4577891-Pyramimonas_sp.AAC.1